MDPFTQRMIENAEKRSKTLGISNTSKFPLTEYQEENTKSNLKNRRAPSVPDKSPKRIIRQISDQTNANEDNLSKENVDVALEINITTGSNVKLQVEVEERDIDADGNVISSNIRGEDCGSIMDSRAQKIGLRDTSKNRLQRLGKLYSDNENLSSPIHCTEGEFHVDAEQEHRPKQRLGRLAELASSINNWEDDTQHTEVRSVQSPNKPKIVGSSIRNTGATPKKYPAPKPPVNKENEKQTAAGTKQLKWDKSVMDALQSQGFERRQSSNSKLVYDYDKDQQPPTADPQQIVSKKVKYQTNTSREREVPQTTSDGTKFVSQLQVSVANEKKTETTTTAKPQVAKGFVSGKAAIFNGSNASSSSSSNAQSSRINQKDPAEMSLKERVALFEKNKGTAPMPITAIGIAPSLKQIMVPQKSTGKVEFTASAIPKSNTNVAKSSPSKTKILSYNQPSFAESKAEGNCIRNTVKALLEKPATISESQISEDIKRQRQQEMEVLLNRYQNKEQKESETKSPPRAKLPPPPPPPMPSFANSPKPVEAKCSVGRHSDGRHSDSHEVRSALEDVKRIKVNPPRDGRLYPGLSDIETTGTESDGLDNSSEPSREPRTSSSYHEEKSYHFRRSNGNDDDDSYMDSEDADTSTDLANGGLGREILSVMQKNSKSAELHKRHNNELRYQQANLESSLSSDNSENVDDYLNEALDEEDDSFDQDGMLGGSSSKVTPRKGSISSNSFSYRKNPKHVDFDTDTDKDEVAEANNHNAFRTPVKSELKVHTSDDTNLTALVHAVGFYRKQQNGEVNYTPIKKMLRTPKQGNEYCSTTDDDSEMEDQEEARKDKIKKLLDESMKQQQIISQTSRALNLCAATVEFSGSIEAVESERHLLVAIHRHRAIKDEILRLNRQFVRPLDAPTERGRLTVKEITIPLNSTYVKKLSEEAICGHHLVCLLKYNENVLATRTVLTLPGLRTVKFPDTLTLNNVYTDFRITLEIYGMIAQRESLPHEAKYHINVNKKGGPKTPKGKKGAGSSMVMPMFQSPAGPNAVRSTALTQYGFIIFSAREVKQSSFTVNDLVNVSPLEGKVHMKIGYDIQIAVDHSGFLTMYEDTSGFGAWHRRWCHLHGTTLSYWKYPEDEKTKTPIGSLDLQSCTSQKAIPAPRDVCARKHTILLESQRPRLESDVATLTTIPRGKDTIVRHLLAADTTEDRDLWCMHFNKTLVLVRTWGKQV